MSTIRSRLYAARRRARQGVIFVVALGVIVILSSLVLVFSQEMRTEGLASANRLAYAQADAVEQGAEKWVLAQIEANPSDAVTICQTSAEAIQVGSGAFWIIRPDPDSADGYAFGIADESGKLNLNTANTTQLLALPGMTEDVADAIVDWRDADSESAGNGAESSYYGSLPEPYDCKNAPFETVEELLLVKGVTNELLHGTDRNHDGVIDDAETAAGGIAALFNSPGDDGRGLANYVTVNSIEPNTSANGAQRINVNRRNVSALRNALRAALPIARANEIAGKIAALVGVPGGRQAFPTLGYFYTASGMTPAEFKLLADQLSTTNAATLTGMININTAPPQVLACLPSLDRSDADALVDQRGSGDTTIAWVFDALPADKAAAIAGSITARSYQYSADIVAVSGDGRAYKRARIIVDARQSPARIVYRKDLTALGWPLPREVRTSRRAGQGIAMGLSSLNRGVR